MILNTQGVFIATGFPSEPDGYLVNSYFNSKGLPPQGSPWESPIFWDSGQYSGLKPGATESLTCHEL